MYFNDKYIEQLTECYLFKNVNFDKIKSIIISNHLRISNIDKEQCAGYAGEPLNDLPILTAGSVRGEMTDFSGRTVKIEDIKAPAVLASAFVFGGENKLPVDIIANEPSTIMFIPKEGLIKIFRDHPQVLKNFLDDMSNRAQFLTKKIRFLTFKTIRQKLAHYLMNISIMQNSNIINIPVTQLKLADFFGVTRPSLARVLAELEKEGIITVSRNKITIVNKAKLSDMSNL
jgi:CRP-like cAMP-binding protein